MICVLYSIEERDVQQYGYLKEVCFVGVPTIKLIQAARTKVFYWQESLDSTVERPTRIARLRLERKREKANTNSLGGGWNERIADRNYVKKRSQNQN